MATGKTNQDAGPLALIAAGGTGGHMFPAQALAELLLAEGWRVTLSTDARGMGYAGGFPAAVTRRQMASATTARGGALGKALAPLRILRGVLAALAEMRRTSPTVVIGFGGYPSIPALIAARILRIPTMIHEQNGVMGRVNALFSRRVDRVACGIWPTLLPKGVTAVHTGNPVRGAVIDAAATPYTAPGEAPDGRLTVLIIGGSQGARILSGPVAEALAALPAGLTENLHVSHQLRPEDLDRTRAIYDQVGIAAEVAAFFDDIPHRMADAQLVIARAGASTIAEIAAIGRPAILVPYAAAMADHQTANARMLGDAGAAVIIPESAFDAPTLKDAIASILTDPDKARAMADQARALGRPDAAARLLALVKELCP